MHSYSTLVPLMALLTLICVFSQSCAVPTQSEKAALSQILNNHPDLASVPSWETLDDDGVYYGSSWNNSFDQLCQNDGYGIYGVFCLDGHIAGLRVYVGLHRVKYQYENTLMLTKPCCCDRTRFWGKSLYNDYSACSGLAYLTNLYASCRDTTFYQ